MLSMDISDNEDLKCGTNRIDRCASTTIINWFVFNFRVFSFFDCCRLPQGFDSVRHVESRQRKRTLTRFDGSLSTRRQNDRYIFKFSLFKFLWRFKFKQNFYLNLNSLGENNARWIQIANEIDKWQTCENSEQIVSRPGQRRLLVAVRSPRPSASDIRRSAGYFLIIRWHKKSAVWANKRITCCSIIISQWKQWKSSLTTLPHCDWNQVEPLQNLRPIGEIIGVSFLVSFSLSLYTHEKMSPSTSILQKTYEFNFN